LLDRPEVVHAVGANVVEETKASLPR
jgi:hypothetical protein